MAVVVTFFILIHPFVRNTQSPGKIKAVPLQIPADGKTDVLILCGGFPKRIDLLRQFILRCAGDERRKLIAADAEHFGLVEYLPQRRGRLLRRPFP